MKIAIDTKEDSSEDIKKVIRMLQHLVGEKEVFENKEAPEEMKEGLFNMFNTPQENAQSAKEKKDTFKIDEFLDEEKDDSPKVIPY